jgi:N-methylhydantoinase A
MKLPPQARIQGPAIIQQLDATTIVETGALAAVDALGNLRIKVSA